MIAGKVTAQDNVLVWATKKLVSEEVLFAELGPEHLNRDLEKYIWGDKPHPKLADLSEFHYHALRQTQGTIRTDRPDWQPWLSYFLESLGEQKCRLAKKLERERLILGDLPELSVQILELCRERGRATVAEVVKATGANRNTIKDHLKALKNTGYIRQHGAGRGSWYGLA